MARPPSPCGHCEEIEKDAARAQFLRHIHDVTLRTVAGHPQADLVGEVLCCWPGKFALLRKGERRDDMESLAACRFAKTDETEFVQALPHLAGGLDDGRKGDVWPRIKIENEPARHLRLFWLAIPGMKLKGGGLRESRQAFDAIDLEIGFAVAGDGHEIKQNSMCPAWHGAERTAHRQARRARE
jgi:hypothetical protein